MDKEHLYMLEEAKEKVRIAVVEGEALVEAAGYAAMKESYNFADTSTEDGWVDKVSKVIRPLLTLSFFFFTIYAFAKIQGLMDSLEAKPSVEQTLQLYTYAIEWIFFQSGAAIGWWFAMRPGKNPVFSVGVK